MILVMWGRNNPMKLLFDTVHNKIFVRKEDGEVVHFTDFSLKALHSDELIEFDLPLDPPPPIFTLADQRKEKRPKKKAKALSIQQLLSKNPQLLRLAIEELKKEEQRDEN